MVELAASRGGLFRMAQHPLYLAAANISQPDDKAAVSQLIQHTLTVTTIGKVARACRNPVAVKTSRQMQALHTLPLAAHGLTKTLHTYGIILSPHQWSLSRISVASESRERANLRISIPNVQVESLLSQPSQSTCRTSLSPHLPRQRNWWESLGDIPRTRCLS